MSEVRGKHRMEETQATLLLEDLWNTWHQDVFDYIYRRVGRNWHTTEDLVSETFLRAGLSLQKKPLVFQVAHGPRMWLRRIAHNLVVDYLRKPMNGRELTYENWYSFECQEDGTEFEQQVEDRERLIQAMRCLTDAQRALVLRYVVLGHSFAEIEAETDRKKPTLWRHYHEAIASLQQQQQQQQEGVSA